MNKKFKTVETILNVFDGFSLDMNMLSETDDFGNDDENVEDSDNFDDDDDDIFNKNKKEDDLPVIGDDFGNDNSDDDSDDDEDSSEGDNQKDTNTDDGNDDNSPSNTYQMLAKALHEDGVLSVEKDNFDDIKTPESFAELIEQTVNSRLDERQKRINAALEGNVNPDEIKQYEHVISQLEGITDEMLDDENNEELRKQLIFQDYLNRGYSKEKAERLLARSLKDGEDIEDAKEALKENLSFYKDTYTDKIKVGKELEQQKQNEIKKGISDYRKKITDTEEPIKGLIVDKAIRDKMLYNATKATVKSDDDLLTAIQAYQKTNPVDANYWFNYFYTVTNGFTNIEGVSKPIVNRAKKSALAEIDNKLRNNKGSFSFGNEDDSDQKSIPLFGKKGIKVDL